MVKNKPTPAQASGSQGSPIEAMDDFHRQWNRTRVVGIVRQQEYYPPAYANAAAAAANFPDVMMQGRSEATPPSSIHQHAAGGDENGCSMVTLADDLVRRSCAPSSYNPELYEPDTESIVQLAAEFGRPGVNNSVGSQPQLPSSTSSHVSRQVRNDDDVAMYVLSSNERPYCKSFPPFQNSDEDGIMGESSIPFVTATPISIDNDLRYPPSFYDSNGNLAPGATATATVVGVDSSVPSSSMLSSSHTPRPSQRFPSNIEEVCVDAHGPSELSSEPSSCRESPTLNDTDSMYHPQTSIRRLVWQTGRVARAGCRKATPHIKEAAKKIRQTTQIVTQDTQRELIGAVHELDRYSRTGLQNSQEQLCRANMTVQLLIREHVAPTIVHAAKMTSSATKRAAVSAATRTLTVVGKKKKTNLNMTMAPTNKDDTQKEEHQ